MAMMLPLGRYGQPEDVANAHVYLAASNEADFVSGVILPIAGAQLGA
jgi:NAD(P)-dependent dehydrogenase (short-subunit alcohol dehydrogenase family)